VTVFVSYSSRDKDAVKSLTQDLQDADEQVWLDQRLAGGDAWWRAILEQIRGCDVFIFALSQNSIQSKPCQAELHYAQTLGLPILPVQVGPVDSMQLNPLATVQAIDYRNPTPNTGMRLIAALHRERARRQPLPSSLPDEPEVPFEYLIRLYTTIAGPDYLSPPDQAALVAQLQFGLREDGDHEAARNDIVMLLTKLRDRRDITYQTRMDVDAMLASIDAESRPQPPIATDIPAVQSPIVDDAAKVASATTEHVRPASAPDAMWQQAADPNLAATQQGPPDRPPPDTRTPPPWWQRQRRQVQLGLIAATVVILAAGTGITGYLLRPHSPASPTQTAQPSTTTAPTTTTTPAAPQMSGHYVETETTPHGRTVSYDWYFTPCGDGCASVSVRPDGSNPWGQAHFANGQWTMDTPVSPGCSDGTSVPDAGAARYTWDANTLAGTDRETLTQAACGNPAGYQETNTLQLTKA
jgi:hypothetical protein